MAGVAGQEDITTVDLMATSSLMDMRGINCAIPIDN
jgi:hypothetical protein